MENFKEWLPFLEKLIWPIFIVILLLVFKNKVNGLYQMATEGRSVEIGGWFKIGEKVKNTAIESYASNDFSIDALAGEEMMVEKGSEGMLLKLQDQLRNEEIKSIDILKITNNKTYYRELLLKYISTLGIKHVVFIKDGEFDGWIDSSVFSGQLLVVNDERFNYPDLKNFLAGISTKSISPKTKTSEVLAKMKNAGQNNIAVVENRKFRYIINKQDILTALVSSTILATKEQEEHE